MYLMHYNPYHDKLGRFAKSPTLFVSGSSHTQTVGDPYYRKSLPKEITRELDSAIKLKKKIIIGDAPGIDRQVQDYLNKKNYKNVEVYGPGKQVRYSANSKWKTKTVDSGKYKPDTDEWHAEKDILMSKIADEGLAVVLDNGGAGATRDNVNRLLDRNKDVRVIELSANNGPVRFGTVTKKSLKSNEPIFESPKQLKNYMNDFKYKEFSTLTPPFVTQFTKQGSCHDQVFYEFDELYKQGLKPKATFIMAVDKNGNGGETHSFVSYNKNNKSYWFENAWSDKNGIHEFSNEKSMTYNIVNDFARRNKGYNIYIADMDVTKHNYGEDLTTFVDKCMDNAKLIKSG